MGKKKDVVVTILCITYNHKDFIEKALNGFLMQKTTFPYEIVVHDDASTDGTTDILLQYQKRYPDKIRLILQEENSHSKGFKVMKVVLSEIKGKYATLCDGDDEWIYENKLQEQYELMEHNPNISLCVHNAIQRDLEKKSESVLINGLEEGIMEEGEIFTSSKGHIPTASYFFRAECVENYPQYNFEAPVGDDPLRFHCALQGDIYFIDKAWCIRNYMHAGSWNCSMKMKDKRFTYAKKYLIYLYRYKEYANGRFEKTIKERMVSTMGMAIQAILPEKYTIKILQQNMDYLDQETKYLFSDLIKLYEKVLEREAEDYATEVLEKITEGCKHKSGKLYIYGAGIEAKKYAQLLERDGIPFEGFVVTNRINKEDTYLGHVVYTLDSLSEEKDKIYFLLGLNIYHRQEVSQILIERGYEHFV